MLLLHFSCYLAPTLELSSTISNINEGKVGIMGRRKERRLVDPVSKMTESSAGFYPKMTIWKVDRFIVLILMGNYLAPMSL